MHIHDLILEGEGSTVEFTSMFPDRDALLSTLVAFANTAGGELFLGVNDDGSVVGVAPREAREYEEKLSSWVADRIQPPVVPIMRTARIDDHLVLVVSVERGPLPCCWQERDVGHFRSHRLLHTAGQPECPRSHAIAFEALDFRR